MKRKFKHGPEELQQIAFFDFCRAMQHTHLGYALAYHVPNERMASIQRRMTLKRAGVRKGVPDICVPVRNDKYSALYIEMKVKPNKPSPEQISLIQHLNIAGNYAVICWSADEAIKIIQDYINNKL